MSCAPLRAAAALRLAAPWQLAPPCRSRAARSRAPQRRAAAASAAEPPVSSNGASAPSPVLCTPPELRQAALAARLADHIYADEADVAALLAGEGLSLVAAGRTPATRWLVADDAARSVRHVIFRGVVWRDPAIDTTALAARLAAVWPTPLQRGVALRAHTGVAALADAAWPAVAPHITGRPKGSRLALAGHSLGGSLALLTAALARLRLGIPPATFLPIYAFGSPNVLALDRESAPTAARAAPPGAGVLQLLQMPPDAVRLFVLDTDPVPRMWHAADPLLSAVRSRLPSWAGGFASSAAADAAAPAAAAALPADAAAAALRRDLAGGEAAPSSTTNAPAAAAASAAPAASPPEDTAGLFEAAGQVFWVRWEGLAPRCERLPPGGVAAALATPPDALLSPMAMLRASLDHNRRAYTAALEALVARVDDEEQAAGGPGVDAAA